MILLSHYTLLESSVRDDLIKGIFPAWAAEERRTLPFEGANTSTVIAPPKGGVQPLITYG